MSFDKTARTLVLPIYNATTIQLSIAIAGLFAWLLICTVAIGGETTASHVSRTLREGNTARVKIVVEAQGDLQLVSQSGKAEDKEESKSALPMKAIGHLTYDEVAVGNDRNHVARYYHEAKAQLSVSKRPSESRLREDRRFILLDMSAEDGASTESQKLYSSTGALTRNELELLTVPANSVVIDELLPESITTDKQPAVGEQWQPSETTLARLLNLNAVTANDVQSSVTAVEEDLLRR